MGVCQLLVELEEFLGDCGVLGVGKNVSVGFLIFFMVGFNELLHLGSVELVVSVSAIVESLENALFLQRYNTFEMFEVYFRVDIVND